MKLRTYLARNKVSIRQFADMIGVHYETARRYVHGQIVPSSTTMRRIIEATNGDVQPTDFRGGLWARLMRRFR